MVVVEVQQGVLGVDEEEGRRMRRRRQEKLAIDRKSNNPHGACGEII